MNEHPVVSECAALGKLGKTRGDRLGATGTATTRDRETHARRQLDALLELVVVRRNGDDCELDPLDFRQRRKGVRNHAGTIDRDVLLGGVRAGARAGSGAGHEGKTAKGGRLNGRHRVSRRQGSQA